MNAVVNVENSGVNVVDVVDSCVVLEDACFDMNAGVDMVQFL